MPNLKPPPLSPLSALPDERQDELWTLAQREPYHRLVETVRSWGVRTSVSALQRWHSRQRTRRTLSDIREAKRAAEAFERALTDGGIGGKEGLAMSAAFWNAATSRDTRSLEALGKLVLAERKDRRDGERLRRATAAERRAEAAERRAAEAEARAARAEGDAAELRRRIEEGTRRAAGDPAAVQAALDAALGVGG